MSTGLPQVVRSTTHFGSMSGGSLTLFDRSSIVPNIVQLKSYLQSVSEELIDAGNLGGNRQVESAVADLDNKTAADI